jgi:hypothetical protein
MFIGRCRVRRRGASELLCIGVLMRCPNVWRLAGSSAAELCAYGCAACSARTFTLAPNERSRARTMADTSLARRLRDEAGSPRLHTVIKHAFGRHKSPAWLFRSGSRLRRRTPRSGMRPVHDLHRMGREACWRHDIAYLMSWRRVTHLQRSLRWGNASRFESSRPEILNTAILQNHIASPCRLLDPL